MIIALEYTQRIVLREVQLFLAFLLVLHQSDARETRREDAQRENGRRTNRRRRWRPGSDTLRGRFCDGRRYRYAGFEKAACRHPALFGCVCLYKTGGIWVALYNPPAPGTRQNNKCVATTQNQQLRT